MTATYPDDGGLKEQVRPLDDTFTGFSVIRRMFGRTLISSTPFNDFEVTHIPGLYYHAHNIQGACGHIRLFGKAPRGWMIYSYGRQVPGNDEWAEHRRWNFGLFCIHHVEPGKKATDPDGWHITWASLKFERSYGSISLTWRKADTFKAKRERSYGSISPTWRKDDTFKAKREQVSEEKRIW